MNEIDNIEIEEVLDILERLDDEQYAVRLLKDFNDRTKELGLLLLNKDPSLVHAEWEKKCQVVKARVDQVIKEIRGLK